ncbi:hypothetical protein D3C81_2229650 [compost metagenome]
MEIESAQRPGDQPRITERTGTNDHVEAFLDHIHQSVTEIDFQLDGRKGLHEIGQHGKQELPRHRQTDAQPATCFAC